MLNKGGSSYNKTFLSYEELEARVAAHTDPLALPKVLDAYEMSRSVHEHQLRNDGTPYFWHSTRVTKILLDELQLNDSDLLISALLHDVLEDSDVITRGVLEYNFGSYVTYIVETLTKNLERAKTDPEGVDLAHAEALKAASEDCMVIKLASRLDNIRCLEFNLKRNPLVYIQNTFQRYLPTADASSNPRLHTLAREIRQEANKFLG
jgi:(p)ppGpp synthase/HD superfamily hydrolase